MSPATMTLVSSTARSVLLFHDPVHHLVVGHVTDVATVVGDQPLVVDALPDAVEHAHDAILPRGYFLVMVTFIAALSAPVSAYWPVITPSA